MFIFCDFPPLPSGLLMSFKYSYPGSPELVFVSHVIHPCHFYIRKYSQLKDAIVLEKKVNQFCKKSLHFDPSDILELGNEILFQAQMSSLFKYCNIWATHVDFYNTNLFSKQKF